ncbi:MAG TPA: LUD domain-containing protein, partial [bacterium]|nr:LUD domain-containing protein [bacterium]
MHIALMGMERLLPTMNDLGLLLSLLPRSATGQKLSVYTSLIRSPRPPGEADGPQERHLVLVDNGRSRMRDSGLAEALYCIRCGACLNACPVFREIGGHAYRGTDGSIAPYPGPIGSVVSPGLFGTAQFGQLAQASSLCGACKEACPVDIDLPKLLLRVRSGADPKAKNKKQKEGVGLTAAVRFGLIAYRFVASSPPLFAAAQRLGGWFSRLVSPRSAYLHLPAFTGWGYSKDLPRMEAHPFRARWKRINQEVNGTGDQVIRDSGNPDLAEAPTSKSVSDQFSEELTALGGRVIRVAEKDLPAQLEEFLEERGITAAFCDESGARALESFKKPGVSVFREPDPTVRCGITGALAGIAETGTLVLAGGASHSLTASLLPEVQVTLLREKDVYAGLP